MGKYDGARWYVQGQIKARVCVCVWGGGGGARAHAGIRRQSVVSRANRREKRLTQARTTASRPSLVKRQGSLPILACLSLRAADFFSSGGSSAIQWGEMVHVMQIYGHFSST